MRSAEGVSRHPAHSVAEFKVKHMMISNVKGQFTGVSGTLEQRALEERGLLRGGKIPDPFGQVQFCF